MPLNVRRHQQKPPSEQATPLTNDLYEKMLSKRGVDDRVELITDPISEDLETAEDDIDTAQTDITTNATAIALKVQTVSYTERWDDIGHAVDDTWKEVDLSSYGVLAGDICEIWFRTDADWDDLGVRTLGSSVVRKTPIIKECSTVMNVVAGAGGVIEVWLDDASGADVYLAGYWRFSTS